MRLIVIDVSGARQTHNVVTATHVQISDVLECDMMVVIRDASRQQQRESSKKKPDHKAEKENRKSYKPFSEEAKKKYIDTDENGHDTRPAASAEHGKEGPSKSHNNHGERAWDMTGEEGGTEVKP